MTELNQWINCWLLKGFSFSVENKLTYFVVKIWSSEKIIAEMTLFADTIKNDIQKQMEKNNGTKKHT